MKKRKIKTRKNLFIFSLILFFILWLNVHIHDKHKIQIAEITDFKDIIYSSGLMIRDEEVINLNESLDNKYISFTHSEGQKTSKDSVLAKIYKSYESSIIPHKIESLDDKINTVKNLNLAPVFYDDGMSNLNQKINNIIEKISLAKSDCHFLELKRLNQEVLYFMNKKSKILGRHSNNNISEIINDLEDKKNNLSESGNFTTIESPASGEFIRYIDGFENLVDYKNILNINDINIEKLLPNKFDSNAIGKIVKSETSYIIFNISESEAKRLKQYDELYLSVENTDCMQNIPCRVEILKTDSNNQKYILITSCNIMNENIASLRRENFKICTRSYPGIKINRSAVHLKNEDKSSRNFGVYVKYDKHLKFKDIHIIFANDDFVICDYGPNYYNNDSYIQPGDKVIVQGKNLHIENRT